MAERLRRLVSSDVVGFAGPEKLRAIYRFLENWEGFCSTDGSLEVELIGWDCGPFGGRIDHWLEWADVLGHGVEIIGIHGWTGGRGSLSLADPLSVGLANLLLVPTSKLLEYEEDVHYVLVHGAEMSRDGVLGDIIRNKPVFARFMVENHPSRGGLNEASVAVDDLRGWDIKAGLAFDVLHYLNALGEPTLAVKWRKMMSEMGKLQGKIEVVHLPIGTLPGNGLPLADSEEKEYVGTPMLKDLADTLLGLPELRYLVIENQWLISAFVGLGSWAEKVIAERTQRVFNDYLGPAGIV